MLSATLRRKFRADADIVAYLFSPACRCTFQSNTVAAAAISWCAIPASVWDGKFGHDLVESIDRFSEDAHDIVADKGTIMDLLEDPEVILILLNA